MATTQALDDHFARLADEALVEQLAKDHLTEAAAGAARAELERRGVHVDEALLQVRAQAQAAQARGAADRSARRSRVVRWLRFPLRALIGVESPWLVLVLGLLLLVPAYRGTLMAIFALISERPLPAYAEPAAYGLLALFGLLQLWAGIALWRCAHKAGPAAVAWGLRLLGGLAVSWAVGFVYRAAPVIHEAVQIP